MIKQITLPVVIAGTLLAGTSAQAANFILDDFSDPGSLDAPFCTGLGYAGQCVYQQQIPGFFDPVVEDFQNGLSNVEGGSRQLNISGVTGQQSNFGITPNETARLADAGGAASVSQLTYDASGSGLNINENDFGGFDFFNVDVPSADLGFDITLRIMDGSGTTAEETLFDVGAGSNVFTTVQFDLNSSPFTGLDFTDIDVVMLEFFGDSDLDAEVDLVGFAHGTPPAGTPEPATMLGLLAVGVMGFARRRQK